MADFAKPGDPWTLAKRVQVAAAILDRKNLTLILTVGGVTSGYSRVIAAVECAHFILSAPEYELEFMDDEVVNATFGLTRSAPDATKD